MVFIGRTSRSRGPVAAAPPVIPSLDDPAERRRQQAVDALGIIESPPEERFDRIVNMAKSLYHTQAAAFSVVDHDREWMKSCVGSPLHQIGRERSFCSVTIQQDEPLFIGDTTLDPRFSSHPGVVGSPGVRFYYGVPIIGQNGERVGALCVIDTVPRDRSAVDESQLVMLAQLIQFELNMTPSYSDAR